MNIAELLVKRYMATKTRNDIEILKGLLGKNFDNYFREDISKGELVHKINRDYVFIVTDLEGTTASTVCIPGFYVIQDTPVISFSIAEYREPVADGSIYYHNREVDFTVVAESGKIKLNVVGALHQYIVNVDKVFYLIDNIQIIDMDYYS